MIISIDNKKIELADIWFKYLYPYLIRFCIAKQIGIEWKNNEIQIPTIFKDDFINLLKKILDELLSECYKEPSQKERSKYSSRFQKITIDTKIYILNYRTDIVGKIGYALNFLINDIDIDMPRD